MADERFRAGRGAGWLDCYATRRRWRNSLASKRLWSAQGGDVGGGGGSLRMEWPVGVVVMMPMPSGAVVVVQPAAILV